MNGNKRIDNHIVGYMSDFDEKFEKLSPDGKNASHFCMPDVLGGQKFVQNYGGYVRSDIAQLNEAASLDMQQHILQRLNEVPVSDANSGLTDAQIMLSHRSKYLQAPSEVVTYLEKQLELRDNERWIAQQKSSEVTTDVASSENVESAPND